MVGIRSFPFGMAYFQVLLLLVSGKDISDITIWQYLVANNHPGYNYAHNMRGIYDVQSLNAFVEVNPATMRGQEQTCVTCPSLVGVEPKIGVGLTPQIIHFNRVFHEINHPFWGKPPPIFWFNTLVIHSVASF